MSMTIRCVHCGRGLAEGETCTCEGTRNPFAYPTQDEKDAAIIIARLKDEELNGPMTTQPQSPSEQEIPEALLAHYWGEPFITNGYPEMEYLKATQPADYNELMTLAAIVNQAADKREQEVLERVHCCDNVPEAGYDNAINVCSSDHITRLAQLRQAAEGE